MSSPPADGAGADDKPRLTEEEKKQNHIASGTPQHFSTLYFLALEKEVSLTSI